ncbi:MAG: UvrD-helicase domain-containing protein, partial [Candidatus Pacebacteria bacterium]|nr:UvrD-helicase domain-containing protein [Candidatus Paceibacterota bacterium]
MKTFEEEYKRLNKAQKEAVEAIEGPVMVVAGPGTGKTQILTLRIANILKNTQIDPENILALTFTESGVSSMRKRLSMMIGSEAYRVSITTFHSFANDIITDYPEYFPHIIGSDPITEVEQIKIIEDIVLGGKLDILKPFGDNLYYVTSILSSIKNLKREGIDTEEFSQIVVEEKESFEKVEDLHHKKG